MTTADNRIREQLKAIRHELSGAREQRAEAKKERDACKDAFGEADFANDQSITTSKAFVDGMAAVATVGKLDDRIADLEKGERGILEMLGASPESQSNAGSSTAGEQHVRAWDGHALVNQSEGFRSAREGGIFSSRQRFGTVNLGQVASREDFLAFLPAATPGPVSTDQGAIAPDQRGIISPLLRKLSLLDLIPSGTTDSNIIEYVQVSALPQSAAETAEGTLKPQEGLTTIDQTAPVRTIAGWVKLNRQALDDVAGLGTLINTLLPYDVRRRVEAQVLNGDGVGQNLLGLLRVTGIGAPAIVAGDNTADAILRAMTTVVLSDADPNFCTLNPISRQNLLLMRAASDPSATQATSWKGAYLYGEPNTMTAPTIWGLTITTNRIVPQATPLVGDSMGSTMLVREGVNVKTSDADQDDFIRNRVTLLAETRLAFPVWRPTSYAIAAQG